MWHYSMPIFGEQVIALLDHLELDQAVVAGTSLGANVALEAAALAPERLRGMVIEMPVLDGAMIACGVAFLPLLLAMRYGGPVMRLVQPAAKRDPPRHAAVPRSTSGSTRSARTRARAAPCSRGSSSAASRRTAGSGARSRCPRWSSATRATPSTRSPTPGCSPTSCRTAGCSRPSSILELRLAPKRLTDEIADFIDECWEADAPAVPRAAGRRAAS